MALWQFKVDMIPAERVFGRAQIDGAEYDEALWWADRQPPEDYRERLAALLPPTKSWNDRLLWFGQKTGDRFDVWLENGLVTGIHVRVDCRTTNLPLVRGLLRLADEWSCALLEVRCLVILPTEVPEFVKAIASSPSCRFMEDPGHWLPKLAAEVEAADGGS